MHTPSRQRGTSRPRGSWPTAGGPRLAFQGAPPPPPATPLVSNAVLGMLIFVVAEAMLFSGLISGLMIVRTSALGAWPPPGQPRLPFEETAINTVALLLSAPALWMAHQAFHRDPSRARGPLAVAILLGTFFVAFQGVEWVALVREGLTITSSNHGSFFYLIIGTHAVHAVAGLLVLGYAWVLLIRSRLVESRLHAAEVFWYFVVGLWPILYLRVYL